MFYGRLAEFDTEYIIYSQDSHSKFFYGCVKIESTVLTGKKKEWVIYLYRSSTL